MTTERQARREAVEALNGFTDTLEAAPPADVAATVAAATPPPRAAANATLPPPVYPLPGDSRSAAAIGLDEASLAAEWFEWFEALFHAIKTLQADNERVASRRLADLGNYLAILEVDAAHQRRDAYQQRLDAERGAA